MILPTGMEEEEFAVHDKAGGTAVVDGAAFLERRRTTSDRARWYEEGGA